MRQYTIGKPTQNNLYELLRFGLSTGAQVTKHAIERISDSVNIRGGIIFDGSFSGDTVIYGGTFHGTVFTDSTVYGGCYTGGNVHSTICYNSIIHGGVFLARSAFTFTSHNTTNSAIGTFTIPMSHVMGSHSNHVFNCTVHGGEYKSVTLFQGEFSSRIHTEIELYSGGRYVCT